MMSGLIDAIWVGPSGYALPDGTDLEPGVTVVQLTEGEATESDNWQPVKPAQPKPDKGKE